MGWIKKKAEEVESIAILEIVDEIIDAHVDISDSNVIDLSTV